MWVYGAADRSAETMTILETIDRYLGGDLTLEELHGELQALTWDVADLDPLAARTLHILAEATTEELGEDYVRRLIHAARHGHADPRERQRPTAVRPRLFAATFEEEGSRGLRVATGSSSRVDIQDSKARSESGIAVSPASV